MTTIELSPARSLASRSITTPLAERPDTQLRWSAPSQTQTQTQTDNMTRTANQTQTAMTRQRTADNATVLTQPAKIALVATLAAVPPITALHLSASGPVEPATWTISDYVVTLPYGTPLFGMTTGALAIAAFALTRGLVAITGTRTVRVLLAVWSAAMLGLSIFPTNLRGTPQNVSSNVHLIAGAIVFAILPAAGLLVARLHRVLLGRSATTAAMTTISVFSGALSLALILNRLPGVIGMQELMLPPGILQRAAGAVEILLLATISISLLRTARGSH